jgi:hypothetical protein
MWNEISRRIPSYRSAVISGCDSAGYPLSARCQPVPIVASKTFELVIAPGIAIQPGPASLLCHSHDEQLWNQESFLVRGRLDERDGRWVFTPKQLIPGIEQNPIAFVRFIIGCRRRAAEYLKARNLPRPSIPWRAINKLKAEAFRELGRGK